MTRLPARLRAIAGTDPVGIATMKAAAGPVSHYLRTIDGTATFHNPWSQ